VFHPSAGVDIVLSNPMKPIDVSVPAQTEETRPEDVFVCLFRHQQKIAEYFVSKEYNVNNRSNTPENYIAGRFIFERRGSRGQMEVVAVAEERATELKTANIEILYLQRRSQNASSKFSYNFVTRFFPT